MKKILFPALAFGCLLSSPAFSGPNYNWALTFQITNVPVDIANNINDTSSTSVVLYNADGNPISPVKCSSINKQVKSGLKPSVTLTCILNITEGEPSQIKGATVNFGAGVTAKFIPATPVSTAGQHKPATTWAPPPATYSGS